MTPAGSAKGKGGVAMDIEDCREAGRERLNRGSARRRAREAGSIQIPGLDQIQIPGLTPWTQSNLRA